MQIPGDTTQAKASLQSLPWQRGEDIETDNGTMARLLKGGTDVAYVPLFFNGFVGETPDSTRRVEKLLRALNTHDGLVAALWAVAIRSTDPDLRTVAREALRLAGAVSQETSP